MPSSIVLVTCDSSSDGAAPNCDTATEITGISAFGSRVTASLVKLIQPRIRRISEKTIAGSGWRIDQAEMFRAIGTPSPVLDRRSDVSLARSKRMLDFVAASPVL